jgi:hypothetical protein
MTASGRKPKGGFGAPHRNKLPLYRPRAHFAFVMIKGLKSLRR